MAPGGSSAPPLDDFRRVDRALRRSMGESSRLLQIIARHALSDVSFRVARWFPSKLCHRVPDWVEAGAIFHIRIALDRKQRQPSLITPPAAEALLQAAAFYDRIHRWHITAFMVMPDHIHALLSFSTDNAMSRVIGDWKHFQKHENGIIWQDGYFDHRLRDDERGEQLLVKINYIRQNPVAAGLIANANDWRWYIDRSSLDA
jgi:REP element-mobilizing transposase RayT